MKNAGMTFNSFNISRVAYERASAKSEYEMEVNISQHRIQEKETPDDFSIQFIINMKSTDRESPLDIIVEAWGKFHIMGEIPVEVMNNYMDISAPSILYPYIRAFISNFTLQTGINAIILPPMNFAQSSNKEETTDDAE